MILNPGFETSDPSAAGLAADWISVTEGTGEDTAEFAGDSVAIPSGVESFEAGWGDDPQLLDTALPLTEPDVEKLPIESMTTWVPVLVLFTLTRLESGAFDAGATTTETFRNSWGTSAFAIGFEPDDLGAGPQDDFVWSGFLSSLGSVEAATFAAGSVSSSTTEKFDYVDGGNANTAWNTALT